MLERVRRSRVVMGTIGLSLWLAVYVIMAVGVLGATAAGYASWATLGVLPMCAVLAIATDQWWARQEELRRLSERRRLTLVVACWVGPMAALLGLFGPMLLGA